MVHTQSQHVFVALAVLAVAAGPLVGVAAAVPDGGDEIDLVVDGSVRTQVAQRVAAPFELPVPWNDLGQDVGVRIRTGDVVLPNPAGGAYALVPGPAQRIAPFGIDHDGIAFAAGSASVLVPWYYMMDDSSVHPYRALYWDTGTAWYRSVGDDLWSTYVASAPGAPGSPFGAAAAYTPDVWLRTAVEEIDLVASFEVLLHSAIAGSDAAGFQRPDAPLAATAQAFLHDADGLRAATTTGESTFTLALPARGPSPGADGGSLRPAEAAAPSPLAGGVGLEVAAAGAAGLLAGLAGYHLIRKSAILKNKVRGSIAEHVLRQPGSTITEIALAVGVTHQTASYHLRLLQEHGLVIGVERGNKRLYFRNDGSFNQEERGLVAVLRDPESMRVLELIRQNPWIMKNEAAAALNVSRNTLNWHLQKLLSAGLVSEARENGHCFLFCNRKAAGETLTQVVAKVEERKAIPGAPEAPSLPSMVFQPSQPMEHDRLSGA